MKKKKRGGIKELRGTYCTDIYQNLRIMYTPVKRSRRRRTPFPSGERTRLPSPKRGLYPSSKGMLVRLKGAALANIERVVVARGRRRRETRANVPWKQRNPSISFSLSLYFLIFRPLFSRFRFFGVFISLSPLPTSFAFSASLRVYV